MSTPTPKPAEPVVVLAYSRPASSVRLSAAELLAMLDRTRGER